MSFSKYGFGWDKEKMAIDEAYDKGYEDAMEHMQKEMKEIMEGISIGIKDGTTQISNNTKYFMFVSYNPIPYERTSFDTMVIQPGTFELIVEEIKWNKISITFEEAKDAES